MPSPRSRLRFDAFEFDAATGELWRAGRRVRLQRQPSRLLQLLLARPGDVVSRDEIRQALWGADTHVDFDRSVNFCVARLRAALRDDAAKPRFVETVPTRGYRFVAAVSEAPFTARQRAAASAVSPRRAERWRVSALAAAAVIVVGLLGAAVAFRILLPAAAAAPKVVVVPFHNETGAPEMDRVAKGVSDATVARLAESTRIKVIGNASGVTFSFRPPDMKALGQSLGAQYLVLGQMQRDSRQMRIVAHLIRVSDQTHVWARTFDSETLDLAQQSSIGEQIAAAVTLRIGKG